MRFVSKQAALYASVLVLSHSSAQAEAIHVDVLNFISAQTAMQFATYQKNAGGVNKVLNEREPVSVDNQPTIRLNRDTLYSFMVVDISEGATITLPDAGSRYRSMMVVNEQNYIPAVYLDSRSFDLNKEKFGSDHVLIAIRTLVDSNSAEDIKTVHELQDGINIEAKSAEPFASPDYDMAS